MLGRPQFFCSAEATEVDKAVLRATLMFTLHFLLLSGASPIEPR
jgi:hypothetical protein